jgi:transposase-like protein
MPTLTELAKEAISKNPNKTSSEIAKEVGCSVRSVERARQELKEEGNLPKPEVKEKVITIDQQIEVRRESAKIKMLEQQNKELLNRYEELMDKYDHALLLKEPTKVTIPKISLNNSIPNQAVPFIQWSDWHVEERIEKKTTRGLNEYNPDIAAARVDKLTINTLKIIKKERQDVRIDELFLCLGGDFINNFLHEHDVQMNYMHPIEAALFAKELLKKAISTLAKNGNFKKIIVMCIRGNHGRLTKRMQSGNDYKMNLEAVLYAMLKQELNDSMFEWHLPESELGYAEVLGKKIRCFHGHQVNYQGGVGDITIPVNKAIMKWDKTEKADWNMMHHYHRYWMPTSNTSLNGSLCGWNSYALSCGFAYEPPLQVFHLLDANKGFTVRTPIHCI